MTRILAVSVCNLAVAAISIVLFVVMLSSLAANQVGALTAALFLCGTALAALIFALKFQVERTAWPVRILTSRRG
jgi:hypothetical protein